MECGCVFFLYLGLDLCSCNCGVLNHRRLQSPFRAGAVSWCTLVTQEIVFADIQAF